nr:MAG TPA: hypothetical protein [Caudoviricetes sp.]
MKFHHSFARSLIISLYKCRFIYLIYESVLERAKMSQLF